MSAAPFMQLYVADYLGDTQHLTTEQHGAYLLLLMAMWRNQGRLPNDHTKLARIARVNPRRWHLLSDDVMAFFDIDGDTVTQKRLVQEHEKALSISAKRSISGKLGGISKALKSNTSPLASAEQMPKHSQIPEPDTVKEEPKGSYKRTGNRLAANWSPSEKDVAFAASIGMSPEAIRREADQFRDYWISKTGKDATKLDWEATWRGWVRRAHSRTTGPPRATPRKTHFQETQDRARREINDALGIREDDRSTYDDGNIIDIGRANSRG